MPLKHLPDKYFMAISNATFFGGCCFITALISAVFWLGVKKANASGFIVAHKFGPSISRTIDPIAFQHAFYSNVGVALAATVAAVIFLIASLVSLARKR